MNRILHMLDQDEVVLNGHLTASSLGRSRSNSRSYDFNRTCLPGNIAYLRLREREEEDLKRRSLSSTYVSRRPYERKRRISEQGNNFLMSKLATRQTIRETGLDSLLSNSESRYRIDDGQTSDSLLSRSALARQRIKEPNTESRVSTSAAQRSVIEQEYDSLKSKYTIRQRTSAQDSDASLSNAATQQQANERSVDTLLSDLATQKKVIVDEDANSVLSNTTTQKQTDKKGKELWSMNSANKQQKDGENTDLSSSNTEKQKQISKQVKDLSSAKSGTQKDQDNQTAELLPSNSTEQKPASTEEKSSKEKPIVQEKNKDAEVKDRKAKASNVEAEGMCKTQTKTTCTHMQLVVQFTFTCTQLYFIQ